MTAACWWEELALAADTEAALLWRNGFLEGTPAVSQRRHGRGAVSYVATYLTGEILFHLLPKFCDCSDLESINPQAADGLEVVVRDKDELRLTFYLNPAPHTLAVQNRVEGQVVVGADQ